MTCVIAEPCVDVLNRSCLEECPVDCIHEGEGKMSIHPDECLDCGACEPACPVEAIYFEEDVPGHWLPYLRAGAEFFEELGSPGGASAVDKLDRDVEPVVGRAPQQGGRP